MTSIAWHLAAKEVKFLAHEVAAVAALEAGEAAATRFLNTDHFRELDLPYVLAAAAAAVIFAIDMFSELS